LSDFFNSIRNFIRFGISPTLKYFILGVLLIISLLLMRKVVKIIADSKTRMIKKFLFIFLCALFIYSTVFVATA